MDHPDRPEWIEQVGSSGLTLKLFASLDAILGVDLLKAFMADRSTEGDIPISLPGLIGIRLTCVVTSLAAVLTRKIRAEASKI